MPVSGQPAPDIAGRYRCAELDAELTIADAGGVLFGAVSGWLGQGRMEALNPIAAELWALPCPRALDHTPPGDWTLRISRDDAGRPTAIDVGCWLARACGIGGSTILRAAADKHAEQNRFYVLKVQHATNAQPIRTDRRSHHRSVSRR